jgi:hypothetical protein
MRTFPINKIKQKQTLKNKTMQNSQVKVAKMKNGLIVQQSANSPEWGFIRVQQDSVSIVNNWLRRNKRSTLIKGLYQDFLDLNLTEGSGFPGKLVIDESLEPFNPGPYQDRDVKYAFEGGPICVVEDQPIYRRTRHTFNVDEHDTLLQHTNVEQIKQAISSRKALITNVQENEENVLNPVTKKEAELDAPF